MDKNRINGSANQAEGAADTAKGKIQNAAGGAKDALRDAKRHEFLSISAKPGWAPGFRSQSRLSCRAGARYKKRAAQGFHP